jgi:cytochrome b subunit of formate dehydrogenase
MSMIERFTRAERSLHWAMALTVFFLLGTGFVIWNDWDRHIRLFGFRYGQAHFWVGAVVFIAAPLLFLALRRRRVVGHSTRFNAGQQLNLRAMQASLPFMLVTGTILHFGKAMHLSRELAGAIKLVHLGSAGLIALAVAGHVGMVIKHRRLITGMLTGRVPQDAVPAWSTGPVTLADEIAQDEAMSR